MMKLSKLMSITLITGLVLGMAGCVSSGEDGKGSGSGTEDGGVGSAKASEEYFTWKANENIITGLSESGAKQKELVIPERCEGFEGALDFIDGRYEPKEYSVVSISFESDKDVDLNGFFKGSRLQRLELPGGLTSIEDREFWTSQSLEYINIPEGVTVIGEAAFSACTALEELVFEGDGLVEIKDSAFEICESLSSVEFPDSLEIIGEDAFENCSSLKSVILPENVKTLGAYSFMNTVIEELTVPEGLELESTTGDAFTNLGGADLKVYVTEGSWADLNFEEAFGINSDYRVYTP